MTTRTAAATYIAAIAAANLAAATWGPAITPWTALLLIGLDLSLRDYLHEKWRDWRPMTALIAAGGAASWIVQPAAGRIALASTAAFVASATIDAAVYEWQRRRGATWLVKANTSNTAAAAADSALFPLLAFGPFPGIAWVIAGQFVAKTAGGAAWAWLLNRNRDPARSQVG